MSLGIYLDWKGECHRVGRLDGSERASTVSFTYDSDWLNRKDSFAIDPNSLPLQRGTFHSSSLFGAMQDCGPDRWGRVLIERAVRKKILPQKPYQDIDYVLSLDDASRIGALRFRADAEGPYLAQTEGRIAPLVKLNALLRATDAIHQENETVEDLRFLLGQGSPLGGARPKSAVQLPDGSLAIAKFPKPDDTRDIGAGEVLALGLAKRAGIRVAGHQLVSVSKHHVSVITRFDRDGPSRIPFLSAATLLALPSGDQGTYTMLADGIRQWGSQNTQDLRELWRRLVFSLLASNFDDHLRNHGFLMTDPGRWALSPAYDLNPVPEIERTSLPKTAISEQVQEPTIAKVLEVAPRFSLDVNEAKVILKEVFTAISGWRILGRKLHLTASTLNAYSTAFEHRMMKEAQQLL